MKLFYNKYELNKNIQDITFVRNIELSDAVFFDIETTGFSAHNSVIYLIGCLCIDDNYIHCHQFFLDDKHEAGLITAFFDFIKDKKYLIHFNGEGFDMPFINKKCELLNLPYSFEAFTSIDLYKETHSLKKLINLDNYKQKTIEIFLNIDREDEFSGGELINVYKAYMLDKDEIKLSLLLGHNLEDIKYMTEILNIYRYTALFKGEYNVVDKKILDDYDKLIISLELHNKLLSPISYSCDEYTINAAKKNATIEIKINNNELKYFYSNYKDYFYLPKEDIAIHKSVASFVDKNFREKAKAANCYIRKKSHYIPQYDVIIENYFKENHKDMNMFVECNESFLNNNELLHKYVAHILNQCK